MVNLNACYRLACGVAIRPERFGGLAYRHDNRRLYFLHSPELVAFVSTLDGESPLGEALDAFLQTHAAPEDAHGIFVRALSQLVKLELLEEV